MARPKSEFVLYDSLEEATRHKPKDEKGNEVTWPVFQITSPDGSQRYGCANMLETAIYKTAQNDGYTAINSTKKLPIEKVDIHFGNLTKEERAILFKKYKNK